MLISRIDDGLPSPLCAWPDGSSSTGPSRLTCWTTSRRYCIDCWTGRHVRPPAGQPRHRGRYHEGRQEGAVATLRDLVTLKFGAEVAAQLPALLEELSEADRMDVVAATVIARMREAR